MWLFFSFLPIYELTPLPLLPQVTVLFSLSLVDLKDKCRCNKEVCFTERIIAVFSNGFKQVYLLLTLPPDWTQFYRNWYILLGLWALHQNGCSYPCALTHKCWIWNSVPWQDMWISCSSVQQHIIWCLMVTVHTPRSATLLHYILIHVTYMYMKTSASCSWCMVGSLLIFPAEFQCVLSANSNSGIVVSQQKSGNETIQFKFSPR